MERVGVNIDHLPVTGSYTWLWSKAVSVNRIKPFQIALAVVAMGIRNINRSLLFVLSLWLREGLGQDVQATCKVDLDGNCIDRTCDDKYPDCEKWALEGMFL